MAIKTGANYAGIIVGNIGDKWLGWPRVIHECIQLTTDTAKHGAKNCNLLQLLPFSRIGYA
jgi:hypothetical protein